MASVIIGDYKYTSGTGRAAVEVVNETKTSYGEILSSVEIEGIVYSVTSMYRCFYNCTSLTIPPTIPSSVTDIRECFYNCTSLTTAPNMSNANNVTDMEYCFYKCVSLEAAPTIPSSVEDVQYCFYGCTSLTTPPNMSNANNVTDMEYCFYNCTSLTTPPTIPSSVINMSMCFYGCTSLTTAPTIPLSVTDIEFCFYKCISLMGNIIVNNVPRQTNYIFYDTSNNIFIIDNSSDKSIWKNIASQYSNVHYGDDDHIGPILLLTAIRTDSAGKSNSNGSYVTITKQYTSNSDNLPVGWNINIIESMTLDGNPVTLPATSESGKPITLEPIQIDDATHLIIYTVNDGYKTQKITTTLSRVMALIDFLGKGGNGGYIDVPGMGIAIGKIAERNGLEVQFPTTIGQGLLTSFEDDYILTDDEEVEIGKNYYVKIDDNYSLISNAPADYNPHEQGWYEKKPKIDLNNYQLVVGKYNKQVDDAVFIVGNGKKNNITNKIIRSNLMEIGEENIFIGNSSGTFQEINDRGTVYYNNLIPIAEIGANLRTGIKVIDSFDHILFKKTYPTDPSSSIFAEITLKNNIVKNTKLEFSGIYCGDLPEDDEWFDLFLLEGDKTPVTYNGLNFIAEDNKIYVTSNDPLSIRTYSRITYKAFFFENESIPINGEIIKIRVKDESSTPEKTATIDLIAGQFGEYYVDQYFGELIYSEDSIVFKNTSLVSEGELFIETEYKYFYPQFSSVVVNYNTISESSYFTFGKRKQNEITGGYSFASGFDVTAAGAYSSVFGNLNRSLHISSAVFGENNGSVGDNSFVIGKNNDPNGIYMKYSDNFVPESFVFYIDGNVTCTVDQNLEGIDFDINLYKNGSPDQYCHYPIILDTPLAKVPADGEINLEIETYSSGILHATGDEATIIRDSVVKIDLMNYLYVNNIPETDVYKMGVSFISTDEEEIMEDFFCSGEQLMLNSKTEGISISYTNDSTTITVPGSVYSAELSRVDCIEIYYEINKKTFDYDTAPFVVGGGYSQNNSKNVFTVGWDGNVEMRTSLQTTSAFNMRLSGTKIILPSVIDQYTTPSQSYHINYLLVCDGYDIPVTSLKGMFLSSGTVGTQLVTYRDANGPKSNSITLGLTEDGTPTVGVEAPAAWRSALQLKKVANTGSYSDLTNKPVDHVVAQGTTGDWRWRRWSSGMREAWRTYTASSASISTSVWVSPIRYADLNFAIPSGIFTSSPRVYMTSTNNQYWIVDARSTSATNISYRIATVSSSTLTAGIRIYCVQG